MERQIRNAVIRKADLDIESELTFWICLEVEDRDLELSGFCRSLQNFGGCDLGGKLGYKFMIKLLEVVGVKKWSELFRKPVRVENDHNIIYRIGHPFEDIWLDLDSPKD